MFSEFVAATQSVKVLGELLRSAADLKNYNEVAAALSKVNETLLAAQSAALQAQEKNSALLSELSEVRKELEQIRGWESRAGQYSLTTTAGGAIVQKFLGQPEHFACPSCFEKRAIHILQDRRVVSGIFACPNCGVTYPINPFERVDTGRAVSDYDLFKR